MKNKNIFRQSDILKKLGIKNKHELEQEIRKIVKKILKELNL